MFLISAATAFLLVLASDASASIFVSKTKSSYLRVTLDQNRQPVRIEGVFPLDCTGNFHGSSRIQAQGSQIRRYKDGSFGYRYVSSRNIEVQKFLRARLSKGRITGFFSYRLQDESRCWSGRSFAKPAVPFVATRRTLNPRTYTVNDSGISMSITLTGDGKPIRLKGEFPIRCDSDGVIQMKSVEGYLPGVFTYFGDGSFGMGFPLADNHNSLIDGLRAKLVDGQVVGSLWYRLRTSTLPGEESSCYSGESDENPTVNFTAS